MTPFMTANMAAALFALPLRMGVPLLGALFVLCGDSRAVAAGAEAFARVAQAPGPAAPAPGPAAPSPPAAPPSGPPATRDMPPPSLATPGDVPPAAPPDLAPLVPPATGAGEAFTTGYDDEPVRESLYGVGTRLRWVTVPAWMLGLFTKKNVPLSSYAAALELFRRGRNFDFVVAVGYQNMSPPDGNWLGTGHLASEDTDFVQFRNLGFVSADASFIWRTMLNEWVGLHYGAGIGLGIVTGKMLRTSAAGCTEANAGDVTQCKPVVCTVPGRGCNEQQLKDTEGKGVDDVASPHRFAEPNVPGAIPIVNVVLGVTFRIPQIKGWEAKLEGGFYDAFFLGLGAGYAF